MFLTGAGKLYFSASHEPARMHKRILFLAALSVLLQACGPAEKEQETRKPADTASDSAAGKPRETPPCAGELCKLLTGTDPVDHKTIAAWLAQKRNLDCSCNFEAEMRRLGSRIPIIKEFMANKTRKYNYLATPLQYATTSGDTVLMRLLLEHGASPDYAENDNFRPVLLALQNRNEAAVDLLLRHKAGFRGCYINPRFLDEDLLKKAAAAGADFNIPEVENRMDGVDAQTGTIKYRTEIHLPLHEVSGPAKLKIMLDAGARPDDTVNGGITLLHRIAEWGSEEELRVVLRYKPNLYARDNSGKLPLHYAAKNMLPGKLQLLLPLYDLQKAGISADSLIAISEREGNNETTKYLRYYSRKNKPKK